MKWGARWGDFWGGNGKVVTEVAAERSPSNPAEVNIAVEASEADAMLHVHVDGYKQLATAARNFTVPVAAADEAVIEIVPAGPNSGDRAYTTRRFLNFTAFAFRTLEWPALFEIVESGDGSDQLSGWVIDGLARDHAAVDWQSKSVGTLYVKFTKSGATHRVYVYSDSSLSAAYLVMYGTRSGDGEITLAEQNDSGLSGSVTVAGVATDTTITLTLNAAAQYRIRYDNKTGTIIEADLAAVADDEALGTADAPFFYVTPKLTAGNWIFRIDWADAAGNWQTGDEIPFAVDVAPAAVSDLALAYDSGTRKATLTWTDPADADLDAVEIRQWEEGDDPPAAATDSVAAAVEAWESGVLTGPVVLFFRVNAKDAAGNVERSSLTLRLELDAAHEQVPERPNEVTSITATPIADGKFKVVADYDPQGEAATATKVNFYHDNGTGTVDWNTVIESVALVIVGRMKRATLSASDAFATDDEIIWGARAATAADVDDGSEEHTATAVADADAITGDLDVTVQLGRRQ